MHGTTTGVYERHYSGKRKKSKNCMHSIEWLDIWTTWTPDSNFPFPTLITTYVLQQSEKFSPTITTVSTEKVAEAKALQWISVLHDPAGSKHLIPRISPRLRKWRRHIFFFRRAWATIKNRPSLYSFGWTERTLLLTIATSRSEKVREREDHTWQVLS